MLNLPTIPRAARALRLVLPTCAVLTVGFWCTFAVVAYGQTAGPDPMTLAIDSAGTGVLTIETPIGSGAPVITVDGAAADVESMGPPPKVQVLVVTDVAEGHTRAEENVTSIGANLGAAILSQMGLSNSSQRLPNYEPSLALAGAQGSNTACRQVLSWTRDYTETITLVNQMISSNPAQIAADLRQAAEPIENDLLFACLSQFDPNAQAKILLFVGDGGSEGDPVHSVEELRKTAAASAVDIYPILIRSDAYGRNEDVLRSFATANGYTLPVLDTPGSMNELMNRVFDPRLVERTWRVQIPNAVAGQDYTVRAQFPDGKQMEKTYSIPVNDASGPVVELDANPTPFTLGSEGAYKVHFDLESKGIELASSACYLENTRGLSLRGAVGTATDVCEFTADQMNSLLPGSYQLTVQVGNRSGQPGTDTVNVIVEPQPEPIIDKLRNWLREGIGILVMIFTAVLLVAWVDYRRFRGGKTSITGTATRFVSERRKSTIRKPVTSQVRPGYAQLVRQAGASSLPEVLVLTDDITFVGSRSDSSSAVLDDAAVAARQCSIERKQGRYVLIPYSQEHPTFVATKQDLVQCGKIGHEYELVHHALIGFGSRDIVYRLDIGQPPPEGNAGGAAAAEAASTSGDAEPGTPASGAPEPLAATLTLVEGDKSYPAQVEMSKDSIQFGREPQMGNDVVLNNIEVSGVHCRITRTQDGAFEFAHVGQSNPSYIATYDGPGRLTIIQTLTDKSAPVRLAPGAIVGIFDVAYYRIDYEAPHTGQAQDAQSGPVRTQVRAGNSRGRGTNTFSGKQS